MKRLIRKIWGKLLPSRSEQAGLSQMALKQQPYVDTYYFTHVPKTGGTSFIVFLDRFFPAKVIFPHQLWTEVRSIPEIDREAYHLIRGHFGGGAVDLFTAKNIRYLTILREPLKLAYSTYEFVKRERGTALHGLVNDTKMDFETFIDHPKTRHLVNNRMAHNLIYGMNYDPALADMTISDESFSEFRKKMNHGIRGLKKPERIEHSKAFLSACMWVGILESFNDAVRLLSYKMAWPPLGQSQKLNINKNPPVITDQARAKVIEQNQQDYELYEFAKQRFETELKQMHEHLGLSGDEGHAVKDDAVDQYYQSEYRDRYQLRLVSEVDYDFSEILLGSQWHRREWDSIDQSYFRWSGPGQTSHIDFWVKPGAYDIELDVVDAISLDALNQMTVKVNNQAVECTSSSNKGKVRTIAFNCAAKDIRETGLMRLWFSVDTLKEHREIFDSADGRQVGFALKAIRIKPSS